MLVGVVPFGLVAGAAPVAAGMSARDAVLMSATLYAGSSQLTLAESLAGGAGLVLAAVTAMAVNLRMLLYSASIAPRLAHEPLRRRLLVAYQLVDQTYALSEARWRGDDPPDQRFPFYMGAGLVLWSNWLAWTVIGALVGSSVPDSVPLDFAVPLVFLVLLVPAMRRRPAVVAAVTGGAGAVVAAELGAGSLSLLAGSVAGITCGAVYETVLARHAGTAGGAV